ncbi:hypothetical protein B9Z65_4514 [Elsinoe australis]|uniref:SURP motif domain-containing protein n=1 Tax=Elsinoe australis TaxID=40998 RepID=A0A2P7Z304_9PEZI|nr:hypothetical protein B9Z65_4514 [Elsinoe australis]
MAPAAVEDVGESSTIKPPPGVIIPPKDTRTFVEKTASVIVRRGEAFERGILDKISEQPKLSFLKPDDYFNSYYQWRKKEIAEGRGFADADGSVPSAAPKTKKGPEEPPQFRFSARMPTLSAVDLEVIKLTALFVAARGTAWLTKFSQIYGQNPQFSFLKPQHSCHGFFTRLVDQYRELINTDTAEGAAQQKKRIAELERNVEDKYQVLERARRRAEWVKYQETQKVRKEEEKEAETLAYAQIDWHDFTLVGTIEFTEQDDAVELPPPPSLNDLQSASLEQRAGVGVDMRLEEAFPTDDMFFNSTPALPAQPSPAPPQMPQPTQQPQMPYAPTPPQGTSSPAPYIPNQAHQGDATRLAELQSEADRAAAARAAATGSGPMRIKDNYIPRAQARRQNAATSLCPICKQQISNDIFEEHVRIEQLSPQWREQTRKAQERSLTTNLSTVDVANNLKRLASQRSDVFDPVTGREIGEGRDAKRVETGSPAQGVGGMPPPGMMGAENRSTDVQEQLRRIQMKHGQGQG